ncbi:MAG: Rrf2 family transcriptional regulator [Polyangiaceae bacterium]
MPHEGVLPASALAEFHGVSSSYLLKHLQALAAVGILSSAPGPTGGYRLARETRDISLLDIVLALEGAEPAFRCENIRLRGPSPVSSKPKGLCGINAAMLRAEQAYRRELEQVSIADLLAQVSAKDPDGRIAARACGFVQLHFRRPSESSARTRSKQ